MNHPDQKHIMNKYAVFKINKTFFSLTRVNWVRQGVTELFFFCLNNQNQLQWRDKNNKQKYNI